MAKRLLSVLVTGMVLLAGVLISGCPPEPVPPPSLKPEADTTAIAEPEPADPTDSDGDGLTDLQESEGWKVIIDMHGFGTDAVGNLLVTRIVASNPNVADTDGDGLDDGEEFDIRTDPSDPDTDRDGLMDKAERDQWLTSPVSADTDGDCRGPNKDLAPNQALFDGYELELLGTSPTLDDTDGDGRTDYEEFDHPFRSPLVSDIPHLDVEIVDAVDVRLDVQFAEELGKSRQYGGELLTSTTTRHMDYTTWGVNWGVTIGGGYSWGLAGGATVWAEGSVGGEKTWGWEDETSKMVQESHSEYTTDSRTRTETAASGSMTMGIRLKNTGEITYTLTDLGYTVRYWEPGADPENPDAAGTFKTMCTMAPTLGGIAGDISMGITLTPGEVTPVIQVEATEVNASRVKDFLARPNSLYLEPAFYQMENAERLDFDFLEEVTRSRTARIIIDFGDGEPEGYRVATNVERTPTAGYAGIALGTVLTEILDIPFETKPRQDLYPSAPTNERVLYSVRGKETALPARYWATVPQGESAENDGAHFEDIILRAGEKALLVLVRDEDGDGLLAPEEQYYGTSDEAGDTDTDGDGLTDEAEVRGETFTDEDENEVLCGWIVAVAGREAYPVWSDPRNPDQDGDGVNDFDEKTHGTDPSLPDTDRDGLDDLKDPYPLNMASVLFVKADGTGDGSSWEKATNLLSALSKARTNNDNDIPDDDVSEIWVAEGTYYPSISDRTISFQLVNHVGIYGGFKGDETMRDQRIRDPLKNGTVLSGEIVGGNSKNVIWAFSNITSATVLDGFTVKSGNGDDSGHWGGAIFCSGGQPRLSNLFLTSNTGHSGGGVGIRVEKPGSMFISNCIFSGNSAHQNGGGLYVQNMDPSKYPFELTIEGCEFRKNQCWDIAQGSGTGGGGAYFKDVAVRLDRCKFEQNVGDERGGGIEITNSTVRIFDCKFTENLVRQTATSKAQDFYAGGGIFSEGSHVLIANSIFWKNGACNGGGLFFGSGSRFWIINCSIVDNYDTTDHGAENAHSGGIKVRGDDASGYVRNCILYGNESKHYYRDHEFGSTGKHNPYLKQICDHDAYNELEYVVLENSCVQGTEPQYNIPGYWLIWDGPTFVNQAAGNLRLDRNSPCIDRANNYVDWDPLKTGFQLIQETDIDGNSRVIDGSGDGEAEVDMGAYEYQGD